jgi:hypothetical protein
MCPLGAECCHLAGEVLDTLQKYSAVEWDNARERRLEYYLDDAVSTWGRGDQVVLGLADEDGPYVGV